MSGRGHGTPFQDPEPQSPAESRSPILGLARRASSPSWHCYSAAGAPADVKAITRPCDDATTGVIEMSPFRS
jgi:hypothetical protein